jgi:hypothetical protein
VSTAIAKNFQVGSDSTATNNFTIRQPATPDGTVRIANGNSGTTTDLVTVTSAGNVGVGTTSPTAKLDVSGTAAVSGAFAVAGNNISAVNSMGFRNRIINGDMRIDQRNAGASVTQSTSLQYPVDRWFIYGTVTSKFTGQRNAGSVTPPTGLTNYLGITSSSAYSVLTGDVFGVAQRIEGFNTADLAWGTANAQTVTISFWVRSSLTGTFGGALQNNAQDRSYPFTYTISSANTWEQKTVTVAGDTSGTWATDNSTGIGLIFGLGAGSTFSATAGAWGAGNRWTATGATSVVGTNGATFYITGVQLEAGSVATPFERRDYGRELIMCQRYYAKTYEVGTAPGTNTSEGYFVGGTFAIDATTTWGASWRFPVSMRANPTVTFYTAAGTSGSMNYSYKTSSATGAVTSFGLGETAVSMYHNGTASGLTAGEGVVISGNIVASAEL